MIGREQKTKGYVKSARVENSRTRKLDVLAGLYLNVRNQPCKKCGSLIVDGYVCPKCGKDPTCDD